MRLSPAFLHNLPYISTLVHFSRRCMRAHFLELCTAQFTMIRAKVRNLCNIARGASSSKLFDMFSYLCLLEPAFKPLWVSQTKRVQWRSQRHQWDRSFALPIKLLLQPPESMVTF